MLGLVTHLKPGQDLTVVVGDGGTAVDMRRAAS